MNVSEIANHIINSAVDRQRFIVAIAGPPGVGKSTLAELLFASLKDRGVRARIVPLDGFHLDNSLLSERGLLDRKGAQETFDVSGFIHMMKRLVDLERDVIIPLFDRNRDVALAGADVVSKNDTILIVEGNYLLLKDPSWNKLQEFWDESIFINQDIEILQQRLIGRWLAQGLDLVDAETRVLKNDIPNALYVIENSAPASMQI